MFFLRNLLLAALALCGVMAQDDGDVELKECVADEFEESYFNFEIYLDHFISGGCEDFEADLGTAIQLIIERVQIMIPEYEKEFIDATVCPLPTFVDDGRRRRLGYVRTRRGTYMFVGAGGCKRCRAYFPRSQDRYLAVEKQHETFQDFVGLIEHEVWLHRDSTGRELVEEDQWTDERESFEERVCQTLVDSAVLDAAVAEMAVVKGEKKLNEMLAMTTKKETKELLDERQTDMFVNEAKKSLEECKKDAAFAKARALFVEKACESEDFATVVVTPEEQAGFEELAIDSEQKIQKNSKEAKKKYFKVKDQNIGLKTAIVKSNFTAMGSAFTEKVKELDAQIKEEIKKLQTSTKAIVNKMNVAKKTQDKKLEAELKKEMEILNEKSVALVDEFESFKKDEPKRIQNEFQLAMGAVSVEAANTFEDYMEAFAVLMERALQGHLNGESFSSCFDKQTKVVVKVEKLNDKREKEMVLKACPTS
jgi:hypothetical protein